MKNQAIISLAIDFVGCMSLKIIRLDEYQRAWTMTEEKNPLIFLVKVTCSPQSA